MALLLHGRIMTVRFCHEVQKYKIMAAQNTLTKASLLNTEPLPQTVKIWVLKHPTKGYLTRRGWSPNLQEARKWNRRSDATLCKNTRVYNTEIKDAVVSSISFTHGFQRVVA